MKKIITLFIVGICLLAANVVLAANETDEAAIIFKSGTELRQLLVYDRTSRDVDAQIDDMQRYTEPLLSGIASFSQSEKYALNNFIVYGTRDTANLEKQGRYELVKRYRDVFGKLPQSQSDWVDLLQFYQNELKNIKYITRELKPQEKLNFEDIACDYDKTRSLKTMHCEYPENLVKKASNYYLKLYLDNLIGLPFPPGIFDQAGK